MKAAWTQLVERRSESEATRAVQLVVPGLDEVIYPPKGDMPIAGHVGMARASLSRFGEGATRVFAIAVSLIASAGGLLLIDEFENGLHYSIQPKIWDFLLRLAAEHDVQVFATTHSRDTLEAL